MIIFDEQHIKDNNIIYFVIKKNIVETKKMIYSTLEKNTIS